MRFISLFFMFFMFIIPFVEADDSQPYKIACYHIPLLVDDKENGAFIELFKEAAQRAGIHYTMRLVPAKRAMRYFEDGDVMGIIPALRPTLALDAALTRQIFSKQVHAFVRRGESIPKNVDSLEGKRIGLTRGFAYPRSILMNEDIDIDYADTTEGSLLKLLEGRIDAVVADGYTALYAIEKVGLSGFHYDLSAILDEQPVYIAFQPSDEGRALARKISLALTSMESDGTMGKILPDITGNYRK
nr:transporter substrate-binding domain-containing protein [uncultured Pseudodesulfovibrio sp.]